MTESILGHVSELAGWLRVDVTSRTPIFEQMRVAIIDAVRDGRLPAGTRMPTVRQLAGEIGLAVNTVARTYRELETAGIIETRGRQGSFVARLDPTDSAMAAAAHAYAEAVRALGLGAAEARRYVDAEFPNSSSA